MAEVSEVTDSRRKLTAIESSVDLPGSSLVETADRTRREDPRSVAPVKEERREAERDFVVLGQVEINIAMSPPGGNGDPGRVNPAAQLISLGEHRTPECGHAGVEVVDSD